MVERDKMKLILARIPGSRILIGLWYEVNTLGFHIEQNNVHISLVEQTYVCPLIFLLSFWLFDWIWFLFVRTIILDNFYLHVLIWPRLNYSMWSSVIAALLLSTYIEEVFSPSILTKSLFLSTFQCHYFHSVPRGTKSKSCKRKAGHLHSVVQIETTLATDRNPQGIVYCPPVWGGRLKLNWVTFQNQRFSEVLWQNLPNKFAFGNIT